MEQNKKAPNEDKLKKLYFLLITVFAIWIISIFIVPLVYSSLGDRGLFGDSFGLINSLFSGFAFAGIIYTIILQKKELALQREELKETRQELSRSANAQEKSEIQQRKQSENLKITAKLYALSTLISYYSELELKTKNLDASTNQFAQQEQKEYIIRIKQLLDRKES